jgi:hypothetical protein
MPQELKQVNGRWVVTGDLRSSDLVPQAPAERIKPGSGEAKAIAGPSRASRGGRSYKTMSSMS